MRLGGSRIGAGGLDWSNIAGTFWIGVTESLSGLGCCWTVLCERRCAGSIVAWLLCLIENDVSCGSSGEIGEERMESGESADRGGGARDANGGE